MASFEELKAKYQPVLQVVQAKGIHLANLHLQEDKLFIKGEPASQEAANAVWDAIKKVNPAGDDIIADFPVDPSIKTESRTYTVKSGDTLSRISQQFYGSPSHYQKIFEANRDQLSDPDKIRVGQELKIPAA